eukprot:COSAG04_NODE_11128_length_729_cov_0.696825_1_plen_223_part_01
MERRYAAERAALAREREELTNRVAPLQAQHDEVDGYLQLASCRSPRPCPPACPPGLPADAPPTTLLAAQRRLAVAGIGSARLGAGSILPSDIAEMVAHHVRGFDHFAEAAKVEEHGEGAAAARLQFRPAALPAAGQKPEATGFLLESHPKPDHNGVYRLHSEHEGWPVLKNAKGRYCYRCVATDKWFLRGEFKPDENSAVAYIVATEGPLPVGAHTWRVWDVH